MCSWMRIVQCECHHQPQSRLFSCIWNGLEMWHVGYASFSTWTIELFLNILTGRSLCKRSRFLGVGGFMDHDSPGLIVCQRLWKGYKCSWSCCNWQDNLDYQSCHFHKFSSWGLLVRFLLVADRIWMRLNSVVLYIGWLSQATMDAQEQQKALIRRNAELAKVSI